MFQKVCGLRLYSQPEMDLAQRLYAVNSEKCTLIVGASDADISADAKRFWKKYNMHADCAVTIDHCIWSNGGLFFRDYPDFEECLNYLVQQPIVRSRKGISGRDYVREQCSGDRVVERFWRTLEAGEFRN